jgi:hypothetical protein
MRTTTYVLIGAVLVLCETRAGAIKPKSAREVVGHPEAVLITARRSRPSQVSSSSGVLIAPNAVLTAAHAVANFDTWEVTAPYARAGEMRVSVKAVRVHPDYQSGNPEHDVAVLVLDRSILIDGEYPSLPGGALCRLDTALRVVGRVGHGRLSRKQLFAAIASVAPVRGNTNVYGGYPQVCEPGDSGGPVYLAKDERQLVGLVCASLEFRRSGVATDIFVPLDAQHKAWVIRQLPHTSPEDEAPQVPLVREQTATIALPNTTAELLPDPYALEEVKAAIPSPPPASLSVAPADVQPATPAMAERVKAAESVKEDVGTPATEPVPAVSSPARSPWLAFLFGGVFSVIAGSFASHIVGGRRRPRGRKKRRSTSARKIRRIERPTPEAGIRWFDPSTGSSWRPMEQSVGPRCFAAVR